jgi:hypothetical protein
MRGGGRCHNSVKTGIFKILFMRVLIEHNRWETNLQKIVKITTPIGWAPGFVNYPKVMHEEVEMKGSTSS